jgi:hypothetical protein
MAITLQQVQLPKISTSQATAKQGINAVASSLILIDNDDYNTAAAAYYDSGNSKEVSTMEQILGRATGFQGTATDASGKADLQYFNIQLAQDAIDAYWGKSNQAELFGATSPAAMGFVGMLMRSAQGEGYPDPSEVTLPSEKDQKYLSERGLQTGAEQRGLEVGTQFGGIGGEVKSSRVVLQVQKGGGVIATGPSGKATEATTIAQRTIGSTLQFAEGGEEEFQRQQILGPAATRDKIRRKAFFQVPGLKSDFLSDEASDRRSAKKKLSQIYKDKGATDKGVFSSQFYVDLLNNKDGIATKLFGKAGAASIKTVRLKAKNVFTQVTLRGAGKKQTRRNFIYFVEGVKPNDTDFGGNWDASKKVLQWKFTRGFEKKLEKALLSQLGDDALQFLDDTGFVNKVKQAGTGILVLGNKGMQGGLDGLNVEAQLAVTKSIPIPTIARMIVPKEKRKPSRTQPSRTQPSRRKLPSPRGRFISNVQLSAILQQRLTKAMPRYHQPQKPIPRYVTGRLARSFRIMADYRQGIMGFFNTAPASDYVDELNMRGWMLDKGLVEPTIRQITQQLFGRQFRVLRTQ